MVKVGGSDSRLILAGDAENPVSWYQWSPDGRYLLVAQGHLNTSSSALMLYSAKGSFLRTLVQKARWTGFYASWAVNGDRVAFVAGTCKQAKIAGCASPNDSALLTVGLHGLQSFAGSFRQFGSGGGCGGAPNPTAPDPSAELYRVETEFGITMPTLNWYTGSKPVFVGLTNYAAPGSAVTTTTHVKPAVTPPPANVAISAGGRAAGVVQHCTTAGCVSNLALLDPATGRVLRNVAQGGDLPVFSPDGKTVYFVRRTVQGTLHYQDLQGDPGQSNVYRTEIWRAATAGGRPVTVLSEDAYGFGRLSVTSDGRSLIFGSVDNATSLWEHRLPGDQITTQLLETYGPTVSVQRLNLATGAVRTLVANASWPAVQP
jgi:dipeptidyl aminopeptidase/acylaminoacyl peptidase